VSHNAGLEWKGHGNAHRLDSHYGKKQLNRRKSEKKVYGREWGEFGGGVSFRDLAGTWGDLKITGQTSGARTKSATTDDHGVGKEGLSSRDAQRRSTPRGEKRRATQNEAKWGEGSVCFKRIVR